MRLGRHCVFPIVVFTAGCGEVASDGVNGLHDASVRVDVQQVAKKDSSVVDVARRDAPKTVDAGRDARAEADAPLPSDAGHDGDAARCTPVPLPGFASDAGNPDTLLQGYVLVSSADGGTSEIVGPHVPSSSEWSLIEVWLATDAYLLGFADRWRLSDAARAGWSRSRGMALLRAHLRRGGRRSPRR